MTIITKDNVSVHMHDTSVTGIRYKLVVQVGSTTKKNKGHIVLDTGNNLYRALGFTYVYCPEFQGRGKKTVLVYYFNDCAFANKLSEYLTGKPLDSEAMQKAIIKHEKSMKEQGYSAFEDRFCRIETL